MPAARWSTWVGVAAGEQHRCVRGELGGDCGGVVTVDLRQLEQRASAVAVERGRHPIGQTRRKSAGVAQRRDRPGDRLLAVQRLGGGDLALLGRARDPRDHPLLDQVEGAHGDGFEQHDGADLGRGTGEPGGEQQCIDAALAVPEHRQPGRVDLPLGGQEV